MNINTIQADLANMEIKLVEKLMEASRAYDNAGCDEDRLEASTISGALKAALDGIKNSRGILSSFGDELCALQQSRYEGAADDTDPSYVE